MTSTGRGRFRDLSIETKMLAIILPLVAIPMIIFGIVGYVVSAGQASESGARYLKERASDLHTLSENPSIRDYFENRYYGLSEEAEVYRQEIERSFTLVKYHTICTPLAYFTNITSPLSDPGLTLVIVSLK